MWKANNSIVSKRRQERMALCCSKKLSTISRGITSKHGDFCCLNCLHSFITENKLKSHEKVCKNKYFCVTLIPSQKVNILEFKQ